MLKSTFAALALAAALSVGAGAATAATVFNDGSTDPVGVGRGVGTLDVAFTSTGGDNQISFDLFGMRSVDGSGNGYDDVFTIALNGVTVFEGSFSMSGGGSNVVTTNLFGWTWNTVTNPGGLFSGGNTSVFGNATLLAGANLFSVTFSSPGSLNGNGNQGTGDESWALNNLNVTPAIAPVPLPAGLPLMLAGLLGLVALRRRTA